MALPFKIFDYELYDLATGLSFCLRCETWIRQVSSPWSGSLDPHIEDHLRAYLMLEDLHKNDSRESRND